MNSFIKNKQKNMKRIRKMILSFFSSLFFILLFVLSFSENLSAQGGGILGLPKFAVEGFYEYPVIPNFFTMIYGVGVDFNFAYVSGVNILNQFRFRHRISSTDDYFPDHVFGLSHRILLINYKILIQNIVSSNSTKPFQSIHSISNVFTAGYNVLNLEYMVLYVGFMVSKPIPFLGKDFEGIPLPFAFFMYRTENFSLRLLPLDINWRPKKAQWLEIRLNAFLSYVRFNTFFYITDFIYMGPELEYNTESIQDANRENKEDSIRLMNLQLGGRFHIYHFNIFLGYSFFNNYSIRTSGKSGTGNTVKPGGGFDFDLGFRFEF